MNIYNSLFSHNTILSEQVARQVFEIVADEGPLVLIIDANGNCLPSSSEKFEQLHLTSQWLENFCSKIGDGVEPVISHINNHSIVGAQLATDSSKYGHILMAVEEQGPEAMLAKIELVEMILNQFNLIAKLTEKCNMLYESQAKQYSPIYSN
jgi:hypothetical protein